VDRAGAAERPVDGEGRLEPAAGGLLDVLTINHYPRTKKDGDTSWYTDRMRDLFDPRSFGSSHRVVTRHLGPALPQRRIDLFDARSFGPESVDPQLSRWRREWHQHARWLASFTWPERFVILVGEITIAYLCLVFGMLVGVELFG
jgi:hypothetical protein